MLVWLLECVFAVSNVLDLRMLGLNDDAYDDPEHPDYEEELLDELEGKFHRPLHDHIESSFPK